MNTTDLKEYLEILIDMEQDINLQKRLINNIKNKISQIESCQMQKHKEPTPPLEEVENSIVGSAIGPAFLIFLGFIFILSGSSGSVFGIFMIVAGIMIFVAGRSGDIKKNEKVKAQWDRYKQEKEEYAQTIAYEKKQEKVNVIEKSVLQTNLQELEIKNEQSRQTLQELYSANIIFPKYRNLVMLCSLYEYLSSGICNKLEGHEGAYNLLEQEIRIDRIISQLDRVIERLDDIRGNQFTLYSAIQKSNQQFTKILESTEQMVDSLQKIQVQGNELNSRIAELQKSSELSAYQLERTTKELHYMNRMKYLKGEYDGIFSNRPPAE